VPARGHLECPAGDQTGEEHDDERYLKGTSAEFPKSCRDHGVRDVSSDFVPMAYTYEDPPSGLQIIGRPSTESVLLEIAYGYEQATRHRKPPVTTPRLDTQ
jgi:Asp-tRNA(Asn)/Glu-tRNA(Gln) amidotransferase A subunit family amidase